MHGQISAAADADDASGGDAAAITEDAAELAPPFIISEPADRTVAAGMATTFYVSLDRADSTAQFQWFRDGIPIPGATSASFTILSVADEDAGQYSCDVRNALGVDTSMPAMLSVVSPAQAGRFVSFSIVTALDTPAADSTIEFSVGGAGTAGEKPILVRAIGPSLTRFGIANQNPAPSLDVYSGAEKVAHNNHWAGQPSVVEAGARVGAFPLTDDDSADAALLFNPAAATHHTIKVSALRGRTGVILAELYDATPVSAFTLHTPRLINFSVLETVPAGSSVSAGFVIAGLSTKTVLIRVIGPSLTNVKGTAMANPVLTLLHDVTPIATNDDWAGSPGIRAAAAATGAMPIDPASKDAALLINLSRGSYAVQAGDAGNRGGVALVEIYEVP